MLCPGCNNDVLFFPADSNVCVVCTENRNKKHAECVADRKRIRDMKYKRKERGTVMGKFVVEHNGQFRRVGYSAKCKYGWGHFGLGHTFKSKGRAQQSRDQIGFGVVMERFETEEETRENHRKELMRVI